MRERVLCEIFILIDGEERELESRDREEIDFRGERDLRHFGTFDMPYDKIDFNAPSRMKALKLVGWNYGQICGVLSESCYKGTISSVSSSGPLVFKQVCWVEMGKICGGCRSFKGYDFCTSSWGRWSSKPYDKIDINAPFSTAFEGVGWNWAKYVVAAGALKGMTSVLLVGVVGQARSDRGEEMIRTEMTLEKYEMRGDARELFYVHLFVVMSRQEGLVERERERVPCDQIDINAPFSIAFEAVGWKWAKYVVAIGALKGMTSVLLVGVVGQASIRGAREETKMDVWEGGEFLRVERYEALETETLCLMQPYDQIDINAPFSIAFEAVGRKWQNTFNFVVWISVALKGMTYVTSCWCVGQARPNDKIDINAPFSMAFEAVGWKWAKYVVAPYDKIDINAPFSIAFEAVGWKWAKYVVAVGALKGMTSVLLPYDKIDINVPFSIAFEALGWKWAKYVVAVGALKGMTFVLLVGAIGQARDSIDLTILNARETEWRRRWGTRKKSGREKSERRRDVREGTPAVSVGRFPVEREKERGQGYEIERGSDEFEQTFLEEMKMIFLDRSLCNESVFLAIANSHFQKNFDKDGDKIFALIPYDEIDINAPLSMAFEAVGWKWAKYVVAVGGLKGMTSVLLVGAVGQERWKWAKYVVAAGALKGMTSILLVGAVGQARTCRYFSVVMKNWGCCESESERSIAFLRTLSGLRCLQYNAALSGDLIVGFIDGLFVVVMAVLFSDVLRWLHIGSLHNRQPYDKIDINAPFSMAFEAVGWKWAKYVVAVGALKGMTSVLLVGAVGQASTRDDDDHRETEMTDEITTIPYSTRESVRPTLCAREATKEMRGSHGDERADRAVGRLRIIPYDKIDINAPFSMAFEAVGWKWAKYVVTVGALKGTTSVLLVGAVGQA
ncbi:hypothetical protein Tco_0459585, partial [Tanacetum coccineum]